MNDIVATPQALSQVARRLYRQGPAVLQAMQHYRPYISPFGQLLQLVPTGSRVLDIGCGGGLFLALLATQGRIHSGLGIDSSAAAIALAQQMCTALPPGHGLHFEARSAEQPLPDEGHDVLMLIDVMHHIRPSSQRAVLEQVLARVPAGGRLVYKDMVTRPAWRAWANRAHDLVIARQWIHYCPLAQIVQWAEQCGFTSGQKGQANMGWYGHEWVVLQRRARHASRPSPPADEYPNKRLPS